MSDPTLYVSIDGGINDGDLIYNQSVKPQTILTIGRSSAADVQLPIEYDVAGLEHCRLRMHPDGMMLEVLPFQAIGIDGDWIEGSEVGSTTTKPCFRDKRTHYLELGSRFRGDGSTSGFSPFRLRIGLADRAVTATQLPRTTRDIESATRTLRSRNETLLSNVMSIGTFAVGSLSAILIAFVLFGQFLDRSRDRVFQDEMREQIDDISNIRISLSSTHASPDWVREKTKAVWLIGTSSNASDGEFRGYGTAWVHYQEGSRPLLITNQHVIDQLSSDLKKPNWTPQVRRVDDGKVVTLELDWNDQRSHPHRAALSDFFVNQRDITMINVFDLAAISLANPAQDQLIATNSLSLANRSIADPGDFVGYIGYPFENLSSGGYQVEKPEPVFIEGTVGRMTDLFGLATDDDDHTHLILADLTAMGGASGSPLFDSNGDVIGIVSSGDVLLIDANSINSTTDPSRDSVRIPVGFTNAYSVDLIRELLSPSLELPERQSYWAEVKSELSSVSRRQEAQLARLHSRLCGERTLSSIGLPTTRLPNEIGEWPATTSVSLDMLSEEPLGRVLFSATSTGGRPVGLGVSQSDAREKVAPSPGIESFAYVPGRLENPRNTRLEVSGSPNDIVQVSLHHCDPEGE